MDVPKPPSKPSRRLSFSALRGELAPTPTTSPSLRSSDTRSPLYTSNSRGDSVVSGFMECNVCGNMLHINNGTFAPHSGLDRRSIEFPETYYQGGALNLNMVRAYMLVVDMVTRRSLSHNPALVGPDPPSDLFALALDYFAKKPTVLDSYKFTETPNYLWEDIWSTAQQDIVDATSPKGVMDLVQISGSATAAPAAPPTSYFRPTNPPTRAPTFVPHSGNIERVGSVPEHDDQHLVGFSDENDDWHTSIMHSKDDSYYCADTGEAQLSDFFKRPVLIATQQWAYGTPFSFALDPWSSFFDNLRVSNRIANYRNLRCNLKVKILVNGTPFDYGRGIFYYVPLHKADVYIVTPTATGNNDVTMLSQRMHLYVDPTTSQGGTLTLPYFWPFSSLNVPTREWANMGVLGFKTLSLLRNCNGISGPVTISVFAWAEDVVLSAPTSQEPINLLPQAGDEYGEGIVSRPAAILAKVAGRLSHVPIIGPYATAAELGATATGNIFKLFGMSKPNIVTDTMFVKPNPMGHMSCVDNPDPIQKLSFDSKQCVTLDPRTTGLAGEDEMNIVAIAQRESYLTDFKWRQTATPETMLFNIAVLPSLWNSGTEVPLSGGRMQVQLPPCAAMALPFTYWRGTMRYRFQIVKSSFHKGRIRIAYEPGTFPGVTCEYNTNMAEIIDIGENVDFVIEVGWHAHQQYLKLIPPGSVSTDTIYKSTSTKIGAPSPIISPVNLPGSMNGSLGVFVVNTLECPASAATVVNDIDIIVSVSAGSDFEIFQPSNVLQSYTFSPQMGAENVLADVDTGIPTCPSVLVKFGKSIPPNDKTALICYGDPVLNIRSLLKRYMIADSFVPPAVVPSESQSNWIMQMSAFPYARGLHPFGIHLLGTKAANICNMTHLNYYSPMYQARRGGVRNKFLCIGNANRSLTKSLTRTENPAFSNTFNPILAPTTLSAHAKARLSDKVSGWTGTAVNTRENELFEAEVPYSADTRFIPARARFNYSSIDYPIRLECVIDADETPTSYVLDRYVSAADDFNLFWFTGCPPITYLPVPSVIS